MNTEAAPEEHVVLHLDDAWYRIPVDVVEGYRVDPAASVAEPSGDDAEVSGFAFPGSLFSPGRSYRQGTVFSPGVALEVADGEFISGGTVQIEVLGEYSPRGPLEIGRDGGYAGGP